MSQENVELVQRGWEHFMATGEPLWEEVHEDFEIHDHDILDAHEYRGRAGYARWLEDWGAAWAEFSVELEEIIDPDDNHVIVVFQLKATGRDSGVKVERQDAMVNTFRNGKTARVDWYNSKQQGLESVGLSDG